MPASLPADAAQLAAALAAQPNAARRTRLVEAVPALHTVAIVEALADEATRLARIDLARAARLAGAADAIAARLGDPYAEGRSARASGHVRALAADSPGALALYERALSRFTAAGRDLDAAITLSGALQTLIYLGRYSQAHDWAARARAVFLRHGDRLRLARLESNLGNVYYRQDRFEDALAAYDRALAGFDGAAHPQDTAIALRNMAVCQISLQQFDAALATYAGARAWCEREGLVRLVAEVDYNIAYLHYLRGEYARALELYAAARARARELDDRYHAALCDLDEAELYVELNLVPEGAALASRAVTAFRALRMRYEEAKALTTLAFTASRARDLPLALRRFDRARAAFVLEENRHWPALLDISKALVLERERHLDEARRLCLAARAHFVTTPLTARTALCDLLLARIALQRHELAPAAAHAQAALALLRPLEAPALRYQAHYLAGQIAEARGQRGAALAAYRQAHAAVETLRSHLEHDELKVAFLDDKRAVFSALAALALEGPDTAAGGRQAFALVEQAKARSLAEHLALHADAAPDEPTQLALAAEVQTLGRRLTALLHQHRDEARRPDPLPARLSTLEDQARTCDDQLARAMRTLEEAGGSVTSALGPATVPLDALRDALAPGVRLLQYAELRGALHVWIVDRAAVTHVPLGRADDVRRLVQLLRFQLARASADLGRGNAPRAAGALEAHLAALHARLLRPVAHAIAGAAHLVVLPSDALHAVPFHALDGGDGPLLLHARVSYAPSASVHHHAARLRQRTPPGALIVALPDAQAPAIADEAARLQAHLPGAHVALGSNATRRCLAERAPAARTIHIATHGRFRRDNPAYSSVRLADGDLTVRDLTQIRLAADLVTLSGCGTGLSVATGGDEVLGLARALLVAGARAVLVSLWDVHDRTAVTLMDGVYRRLAAGEEIAAAVAAAQLEVRSTSPSPFFWAPFVLIGASGGRIIS